MTNIAFHSFFVLDNGPLHYFSVLGRALFTAQRNCRAIAGFLLMREHSIMPGSSVLENPVFQKDINKIWRKTLGQHVHGLAEIYVLSDDTVPIFKAAVAARNEIAHSVAMDVSKRLDFELDERIEHIYELVRKIAEADKIASTLIHLLNRDSLPTRDFFASYEDRVAAWVFKRTFEE